MSELLLFPGESGNAFNLLPPELSDGAQNALFTYKEAAKDAANPLLLQRISRKIATLALFADQHLPSHAYDAAALMTLGDQLQYPNRTRRYRAASDGLHHYFNRNGRPLEKSNTYVGTLLGDFPHIEASANSYRQRLSESQKELLESDEAIPANAWINFRVGADIPEIARVHHATNVESHLIKAADAVDRIMHAPDDDRELFRRIIQAESVHSIPLEAYGLHAFDMLLQSTAGKMRVSKSGHLQLLEQTSSLLDRAKTISTEDILHEFFGRKPDGHLFQTAKESLYNEEVIFTSTPLEELTNDRQQGELHARFKTVGKYALKLLRNPNYDISSINQQPSDLFGMLAVLPSASQLGQFFGRTVTSVFANSAITLKTAASKKKPLFIQGSPGYIRQICQELPPEVLRHTQINEICDTPADHMYQVAKFTCELTLGENILPIEFQFQTIADRANARLGKPAHVNHNAKTGGDIARTIPGTDDDLRIIYSRKLEVDLTGEFVNSRSIKHGEEFRDRYMKSRNVR
jgi:hypothetical protein